MRVVDSNQLLVTFPHSALSGKQFFRSGFISNMRSGSDVSETINRRGALIESASDKPTTLRRI
jgi:hypothetical protein